MGDAFHQGQSMQTSVGLSFTGPQSTCGLHHYISFIADLSSCVSPRVRVLAMSTAQDGETTKIVDRVYQLRRRSSHLWQHAKFNPNVVDTSTLATPGECNKFLELWHAEHIDHSRFRFRDEIERNGSKLLKIRTRIEEAYVLILHCEATLGLTYPQADPSDKQITEDNRRHDCFSALERTLRELQYPFPVYKPVMHDTPMNETSPASGPATPPVPSPHIATVATPTPIFSHVSPAYAEPQPMTDEVYTAVKQEHDVDQIMESESVDRAHLRHDSHLGSHGTPVESPMETKLPSISTWQMPETLAQIPATRPYDPILSRTSPMHNSPLMDPS